MRWRAPRPGSAHRNVSSASCFFSRGFRSARFFAAAAMMLGSVGSIQSFPLRTFADSRTMLLSATVSYREKASGESETKDNSSNFLLPSERVREENGMQLCILSRL